MTPTRAVSGSRLDAALSVARWGEWAALMTYLVAGFPDPEASVRIGRGCVAAGAGVIELGIPAEQMPADGPVIQRAARAALSAGTTPEVALEVCRRLSADAPVVLMAYAHTVCGFGAVEFVRRAADAGAAALLAPDLRGDPEETAVRDACRIAGLAFPTFTRATAPESEFAYAARAAGGFLYLATVAGTSGERATIAPGIAAAIARARTHTRVPIAVGFGVSEPRQARAVARAGADAVVVGSRLVRAATEAWERGDDPAPAVAATVAKLVVGLSIRASLVPPEPTDADAGADEAFEQRPVRRRREPASASWAMSGACSTSTPMPRLPQIWTPTRSSRVCRASWSQRGTGPQRRP